ncbi:MAG TPA: DNA repair protein RadC [Acidimicrobiia bacterium]|nr:DNA repair protein RadC [Acidimicrobiia bacterium]
MTVLMAAVPPHERPRERLIARGAQALNERELLALLLRSGAPGLSALDLAAELLAEYRSLNRLASAEPEELSNRRGIGPAKAASIIAAFHLANRAEVDPAEPNVLRTVEDVVRVARQEIHQARRERVLVLVCDSRSRLVRRVIVSEGSIDRSLVPVREILNAVLRHDGRSFALAHNHPSGDPQPSDADRRSTEAVAAAAKVAGLRFLGHVIVGGASWQGIN